MVYGNNNSSVVTEDYLAGCEPIHSVPSYASLDEMVYFVIEASEEDFNNIMMETGISELQYYEENHTEYIYEAESQKGFVAKIQKAFEDMWKRIQDMIQKALDTINTKAMNFRRDVMKKIDTKLIKDKKNTIKDDMKFGSSYEFMKIPERSATYRETIKAAEKDIKGYYDTALAQYKNGKVSLDDLESKISDRISKCTGSIAGRDGSSTSTLVKSIKNELRGHPRDWTGAMVKSKWEDIYKEVTEFPQTKRDLKKEYDEVKKSFNETIKSIKEASDAKFFEASVFSKAVKGYKSLKQILTCCEQASISVLNERYNFYRTVVLRVIGSKKVKQESAMVSESSTSDAIDSLFNW